MQHHASAASSSFSLKEQSDRVFSAKQNEKRETTTLHLSGNLTKLSGLILLKDSAQVRSSTQHLVRYVLRCWTSETPLLKTIVIIGCEQTKKAYHLPSMDHIGASSTLHHVDYFSDPLGWLDSSSSSRHLDTIIENCFNASSTPSVMLIDSVSRLISQFGEANVFSFLVQCQRKARTIFAIVHTHQHHDSTLAKLDYLSKASITLMQPISFSSSSTLTTTQAALTDPADELDQCLSSTASIVGSDRSVMTTSSSPSYDGTVQIVHKRSTGKCTRHEQHYRVLDERAGKLSFTTALDIFAEKLVVAAAPDEQTLEANKPDPTAGLTFNLKLSQQEREKKDAMVLPYQQHLQQKSSSSSSGMIYFDANDQDFDQFSDDDPDDDLDI